jgi:hypothetical protein
MGQQPDRVQKIMNFDRLTPLAATERNRGLVAMYPKSARFAKSGPEASHPTSLAIFISNPAQVSKALLANTSSSCAESVASVELYLLGNLPDRYSRVPQSSGGIRSSAMLK